MFLCPDCHKETKCQREFIESLMTSRGPCESCGKVSSCLDCHGY